MNTENHNRFKDADWYDKSSFQNIVVGGAGGIGSWLALFLTRIGHTLYIYDDDTIDQTNMAGQFYNQSQVGDRKTAAVKDNCRNLNGANLVNTFGRYDSTGLVSPIMVTCFDNMAGRKLMFEKWAEQKDRELFLDAGGKDYSYIACVNDSPLFISALADIVKKRLN